MKEQPLDLGKLGLGLYRVLDRSPDEEIDVIVHVAGADHVPAGAQLRSRITARILTVRVRIGDLPQLAHDPEVLSIAGSAPLPLVPPKREPKPR